jgi:hypothetical protein
MQNDEALRLRLSKEIKAALQKLAERNNRKLSDYIRLELVKIVEKENKKK